jgi:hypothetical protein
MYSQSQQWMEVSVELHALVFLCLNKEVSVPRARYMDWQANRHGMDTNKLQYNCCHSGFWVAPSPIQWVTGTLLKGVKQPDCEADHSCPFRVLVKKEQTVPPLPHMPSCCTKWQL